MKRMSEDTDGFGVLGVIAIVLVVGLFFLIAPMIIGWAMAYLIHLVTGEPEITDFWGRWILGIAVIIVGSVFKPDVYYMTSDRIRGKSRDWRFSD